MTRLDLQITLARRVRRASRVPARFWDVERYKPPETPMVARAKDFQLGEVVSFEAFDSSSRSYRVQVGELFLAKNANGAVLAGCINRIQDDTHGAPHDKVSFSYRIFEPNEKIVAP